PQYSPITDAEYMTTKIRLPPHRAVFLARFLSDTCIRFFFGVRELCSPMLRWRLPSLPPRLQARLAQSNAARVCPDIRNSNNRPSSDRLHSTAHPSRER